MAIYRSDQAQLTFAAEAVPGASPERAIFGTPLGNVLLNGAVTAGARTIAVDGSDHTNIVDTGAIGSFISIESSEDGTARNSPEVRRVVNKSAITSDSDYILTLDYPIAFDHANNEEVKYTATAADLSLAATTNTTPYITWIPGIYDTVDAPDPEEAHEARYMLGQNTKRNAYQIVKGQQAFNGTVSGMVLINGWPLRFPIGSVVTVADTWAGSPISKTDTIVTASKGAVWVTITAGASTIAENTIGGTYIEFNNTVAAGPDTKREIRKIVDPALNHAAVANAASIQVRVNYPVNYDYSGATNIRYGNTAPSALTHTIYEQTALTNVTWNLNVKDEDGTNAFQRRYYGGKVTGLTLTAEEGGLVTCDWDTAQFLGMIHNQKFSASTSASTNAMRRFNPMIDIAKTHVGAPVAIDSTASNSLPTSEPYYFSEGAVKLFGTTVARLRTFTLTIANNEEARYYIRQTYNDDRGPFEIQEQQREYTMTATIGLPDSSASDTAAGLEVWKELVLGVEHEAANGSTAGGMTGFDVELKFQRGGSATDQITIRIPGDYDGSTNTSAKGGGYQQHGAVIRSAAVNIDGSNPMEQSVDILFSDLAIEIKDSEPFYP